LNKIAFIAIVGVLSTSTAFAADLSTPFQPTSVAYASTSAFDWSGFYAGINAGYGWAKADGAGLTSEDDIRGWLGGAQVGYNYDFGGFVLGAEGDIQISGVKIKEDLGGGNSMEVGLDAFGSVRARAGISADRFLPYVTAGVAWGRAGIKATGPGVSDSHYENYVGWTVGGGLEYAATDNITVRGEYLYTDFGARDFGLGSDIALKTSVVRAGVNFKF
jgi:outer membrane immunogenic protein